MMKDLSQPSPESESLIDLCCRIARPGPGMFMALCDANIYPQATTHHSLMD